MSETIFITGGAGNLARQLATRLLKDGDRVVLFDLAAPTDETLDACECVAGDVTQTADVRRALDKFGPDKIVHFAALLSGRCEQDRPQAWRVNVQATFDLLEEALDRKVGTVLFTSTAASYGGSLPDPLPEDQAQWPEGLYGVSKVAAERLGHYYRKRHGLDFRGIRLPIVISPFAHRGAASAYASLAFIDAALQGRHTVRVAPTTRVPAIYAPDAVRAVHELLKAPRSKLSRTVYNVEGLCPTMDEIVLAIQAQIEDAEIDYEPDADIRRLVESWPRRIDDASARHDWGWSPQYDLKQIASHLIGELRRDPSDARGLSPAG
jgi:threonine 3-dehydrogenase